MNNNQVSIVVSYKSGLPISKSPLEGTKESKLSVSLCCQLLVCLFSSSFKNNFRIWKSYSRLYHANPAIYCYWCHILIALTSFNMPIHFCSHYLEKVRCKVNLKKSRFQHFKLQFFHPYNLHFFWAEDTIDVPMHKDKIIQ